MHVEIDFDKPRRLRFDLAAIKELEALMGGQPLGAIIHLLANMGITALCNALYTGLKHEDRTLNVALVTRMLERYINQGKSLKVLCDRVGEAIEETGLFKTPELDDASTETPVGNAVPEPVASQT